MRASPPWLQPFPPASTHSLPPSLAFRDFCPCLSSNLFRSPLLDLWGPRFPITILPTPWNRTIQRGVARPQGDIYIYKSFVVRILWRPSFSILSFMNPVPPFLSGRSPSCPTASWLRLASHGDPWQVVIGPWQPLGKISALGLPGARILAFGASERAAW